MPTRRVLVLAAAACVLILPQVPVLGVLAYPLRLLVTSLHEIGHAVAALLTGGQVLRIVIEPDTSGVTWTTGGNALAIASAGYIGSTLFGSLLLVLAQKGAWHRWLLLALLLFFGAFTVLYARNWLSILVGCFLLVLLLVALRTVKSDSPLMYISLDLVALGSCLYALHDFVGLFLISMGAAHATGVTDAEHMADLTGLPAPAWALGWGLFSLVVAWQAVRIVSREDEPCGGAEADEVPPAVPED